MRFLRVALLLAFSALPSAATQPSPKRPAAIVTIENFRFAPSEVTVPVGSVVKWVNKYDVPHTATAKGRDSSFDSSTLDTDDAFSFEFKRPGVYSYYCKVHPHMTGKVIVK